MAVICREMPFRNAERDAAEVTAEMGGRNNHSVAHPFSIFLFWSERLRRLLLFIIIAYTLAIRRGFFRDNWEEDDMKSFKQ